jgi:hypothetical protein
VITVVIPDVQVHNAKAQHVEKQEDTVYTACVTAVAEKAENIEKYKTS